MALNQVKCYERFNNKEKLYQRAHLVVGELRVSNLEIVMVG